MRIRQCVVWVVLPLLGIAGCSTLCGFLARDEDGERRAGYPSEVSRCAKPSDTGHYVGYQVGGGAPEGCGDGPDPEEGTWGWDYRGCCWVPSRVILDWWHGRRYQAGSGAYKTDGPRLPEHEHEGGEHEHKGEGE
jgi:hypothetical protein